MQKRLPVISILLLGITLVSLVFYPAISPTFGMISLLLSLAFSTYAIFQKHKGTENARAKILKDAGVMVLTLIIVIFVGGVASMLANARVGIRFGEAAGFASAIGASFAVGYLIRKGMLRFAR